MTDAPDITPEVNGSEAEPAPAAAASGRKRFALAWWTLLAVFVPAFVLRIVNVGLLRFSFEDEIVMVPNAYNYIRLGFLGPDNWFTQPGVHFITFFSALLFGNDQLGWSFRNVILGAGTAVMTFLVARQLFRRPFVAISAAALVALDSVSIAFSHGPIQDVAVSFLLLSLFFFCLRAYESDRTADWLLAGLAGGAAGFVRWYAFLPVALAGVLIVVLRFKRDRGVVWSVLGFLGVVPIAVYLVGYAPWIARGYSLSEFVSMQSDAIWFQEHGLGVALTGLAGAQRWFTGWVVAGMHGPFPNSYSIFVSDLFLWVLMVPCVLYLLWRGIRTRAFGPLLLTTSFLGLYAFFATAGRPINLYSSLPLIPIGFIAVGYVADRLLGNRAWVFLGIAVAWSLYLYPLTSGIPVPSGMYDWIVRMAVRS